MPAITYNERYAFLLGYPGTPSTGWVKVPAETLRGGMWQILEGETFDGQPVYFQLLPDGIYPENFAVRVGERWVSSLQTREWTEIQLAQTVRADLPGFLRPVFPYRAFVGLLLGSDDKIISLAAHESFHAWQGQAAPQKFSTAEGAARLAEHYPWQDESLAANWRQELELLSEILRRDNPASMPGQARRFLELRAARRQSAGLGPELTLLSEHLSNPEYRLITVTGPGGVGKTRLALQAASTLAEQFADGVYWAPLADIHSDIDLALAIVHALHLELAGAQDIFSQLLQALRNDRRDRLLVLDNFEQLLPVGGAALLLEVLRAAPRLTLLVTSRERLNLQAEAMLAQKRSGNRGHTSAT